MSYNNLPDTIQDTEELTKVDVNRRRFLLAGGASLGAAALASASGMAFAQTTDAVKRIQPRAGYTLPLPQNWVANHVSDDVHPQSDCRGRSENDSRSYPGNARFLYGQDHLGPD
jgi:hypothetical protein